MQAARTLGVTCGNDDIDLRADELGSVLRKLIDAKAVAVRIVDEVLRFDEALLTRGSRVAAPSTPSRSSHSGQQQTSAVVR